MTLNFMSPLAPLPGNSTTMFSFSKWAGAGRSWGRRAPTNQGLLDVFVRVLRDTGNTLDELFLVLPSVVNLDGDLRHGILQKTQGRM